VVLMIAWRTSLAGTGRSLSEAQKQTQAGLSEFKAPAKDGTT
jgi:hypothetical protein